MMSEEEISCEFCLQSSTAIKQMVSFFLFGWSPRVCNLACNSKKVGSLLARFIRCLKNPGCFWSANEKRLSPFWNMKTWLRSHGGDEAAWLSSSDIILVSVIARKFLTTATFCLKIFALLFHPSNEVIPTDRCLLFGWLCSLCCGVQVMFLLPEIHWVKQFCVSWVWNYLDAD